MISIVIPVLNEEHYIGACLESLVPQQPAPDEIVIADNGSTDRTVEVVQSFSARHPELGVKIVTEMRRGIAPAREAGWRAASGDLIIQLDADETLPPDWLSHICAILHKHPEYDMIGGNYHFQHPPLSIALIEFLYNLIYPPVMELTKSFMYFAAGTTIVKRDVLEKMNGYADLPANRMEDYYLCERAHALGFNVHYLPSIFGYHSLRRYEKGGLRAWLKWGAAMIDSSQYEASIDVPTRNHPLQRD